MDSLTSQWLSECPSLLEEGNPFRVEATRSEMSTSLVFILLNHTGYNMTDLIGGSHFSLGLLFEAILNCKKNKTQLKGKVCEILVNDKQSLV
jgi:hypothetical protein